MRIAFYTPRVSHLEPGVSGDRILVPNLLAGLERRGHEVEIISRVGVYDFWRGRVSARRLLAEAFAVRRRVRRFAPDAWLVYGTSPTYPDIFGWWQRPGRYVLLNTTGGRPVRLKRRWRRLFTYLHGRTLARADAVIAVREKSAELLRAAGVGEQKLLVLPPAAELWELVPPRDEARERLALPADAPVVLWLGRLTEPRADGKPWKTEWLFTLLEQFAATPVPPETVLLIVGDGAGRERAEKRIAELGLGERVRLAGAVPHHEVRWYYAACDLFAYVATSDRIWHAGLEAQACGRPLLTLRNSSSELVVEHGRTGLLAADLDEFRAKLGELASDRVLCETMGLAARAHMLRSHSVETRVRQIEALLDGHEWRPPRDAFARNGRPPQAGRSVLVTGGLGFIGSFVSEAFAARGDAVTIVDSGVSNVIEADELDAPPGAVRHLDLSVEDFLDEFPSLAGFELVVHCAAYVGPAAILRYPGRIGSAIVKGTAALIEACIRAEVPLLNFSSAEVYGRSGVLVEGSDIRVPARYNARIEYALGKLTAEAMCVMSGERGLRTAVLRPFNVAGPRQSSDGGFVLPTFVQQALAGEPLTVFATGEQRRALTSVRDICRFVTDHLDDAALERPRVFNVGNPANATTVYDLAVRVRDRLESSSAIVFADARAIHGPGYEEAESFEKLPDIRNARDLGWEPRIGLDQLIDETASYYREHEDVLAAKRQRRLSPYAALRRR